MARQFADVEVAGRRTHFFKNKTSPDCEQPQQHQQQRQTVACIYTGTGAMTSSDHA